MLDLCFLAVGIGIGASIGILKIVLGCSLPAGFTMAAAKSESLVQMITVAAALAVNLYIVTGIEFPRMGLIRVGSFDHFLSETLETSR